MEYTTEIFLKKPVHGGGYTGWHDQQYFAVDADSLEGAIKKIKERAKDLYPESLVHINRIRGCNQEILYDTAWDELGPVASFLGEKRKLNKNGSFRFHKRNKKT